MQKVGVVGLGPIGNRHATIYHELDNVQLIGVCDIDPSRADQTAARLGVPAFYQLEDMLNL